jgi:hypothetical protein
MVTAQLKIQTEEHGCQQRLIYHLCLHSNYYYYYYYYYYSCCESIITIIIIVPAHSMLKGNANR